jgi:hypothetical protein
MVKVLTCCLLLAINLQGFALPLDEPLQDSLTPELEIAARLRRSDTCAFAGA